MKQTKLYALYTAINDYKFIRNLWGCIKDADNINQYVTEAATAQNWIVKPLQLFNEEATKANIITQLIGHLGQAGENDICLFYFAGHGGQETVHTAFLPHEPDGKLEVLACYDSHLDHQGSFLADKELRYLIYQLYQKTKAQIITIFDCCHSGTNTRNPDLSIRRLMDSAPKRKWEDFIFHHFIEEKDIQNTPALEQILPQGKHVHLAACEDKQQASEIHGEGVFTSNLLTLLRQTKGTISYQNLINALRLKLKNNYRQTPQLYARGDKNLIYESFLGGLTEHQKQLSNIVYNTSYNSWLLDMGAIHGVNEENTNLNIEVQNHENQLLGIREITSILPNHTVLRIDNDFNLDKNSIYQVYVSGIITQPLNIYCYGEDEGIAILKAHLDEHSSKAKNISLVDTPYTAAYWVLATNNSYIIQLPANKLAVAEKLNGYDKSIDTLVNYLQHIAQWRFIKNLQNPHTRIKPNPPLDVQIFVISDENEQHEIGIKNNEAVIPFQKIPNKESKDIAMSEIKIKIKNNTNSAYYCALLHLSQEFDIFSELIEGQVIELLPDKEVWALGGQAIPIEQEDYIKQFNWEAETSYLKLMVSTQSFSIAQLSKEGLPKPKTSDILTRENKRALILGKYKKPNIKDWTSQLIELNIPNPYYDENDTEIV